MDLEISKFKITHFKRQKSIYSIRYRTHMGIIGRDQQNNMIPDHLWNSYDSSAEHTWLLIMIS